MLADCTLKKKAAPEFRLQILNDLARIESPDHRGIYARNVLAKGVTP